MSAESRVALCLVSHSRALAEATRAIARQMTGDAVLIECAAGASENGQELGTDASAIAEALARLEACAGILILMDLGSAILSAETALELVDEGIAAKARLSAAPFVEGTLAAAVRAAAGGTLEEVSLEASRGLAPKAEHLNEPSAASTSDARAESARPGHSISVRVADKHGLHARPAARLATKAADYDAAITVENLTSGKGPAPISSPISLAALGARHGQTLRITASGPDALAALDGLAAVLQSDNEAAEPLTKGEAAAPRSTRGQPISPGIAEGPVVVWQRAALRLSDHSISDVQAELGRLRGAIERVLSEIGSAFEQNDMAAAHAALLRDPELVGKARKLIEERKLNAAWAWNRVVTEAARVIAALEDPYLSAREADIRDVGQAVLHALCGETPGALPQTGPCVVLVDELLPSEVARLDPARVLGVLDRRGGPTSHAAILLRGAGIPAVFGVGSLLSDRAMPERAALNGATGEVWLDPDEKILAMLRGTAQRAAPLLSPFKNELGRVLLAEREPIELWANVAGLADARLAKQSGALGVGLLRTEMLFLDRQTEPSEDEQAALLSEILAVFEGDPVVIRTLDAGGDKALPYLNLDPEPNPSLGVRGLRLSLKRKALFEAQLRAILRAGYRHDMRILLPMVTTIEEITAAREAVARAHQALAKKLVPHAYPVPIGIMIEIPAAALMAPTLARYVDFFSIGTNDLTQYTLAAERGHAELASLADAAHPSILALIERVAKAANAHHVPVTVCGEAAADPLIAPLLLGLGVKKLSMGALNLSRIAEALQNQSLQALSAIAEKALLAESAEQVRALARSLLLPVTSQPCAAEQSSSS